MRAGVARDISLGRSLRPSWASLTRRRLRFGILPALAADAGSTARATPGGFMLMSMERGMVLNAESPGLRRGL